MAQSISLYEALEAMSRGLGKPVLYISFLLPDIDNVAEWEACFAGLRQAAPYLFDDGGACNYPQILTFGEGFIVCEDEEELRRLYDLTVGEDGPTPTNKYDGPVRVYALTSLGSENS